MVEMINCSVMCQIDSSCHTFFVRISLLNLNACNDFVIVSWEQVHCIFDQPRSSSGFLDFGGIVVVLMFFLVTLFGLRCSKFCHRMAKEREYYVLEIGYNQCSKSSYLYCFSSSKCLGQKNFVLGFSNYSRSKLVLT